MGFDKTQHLARESVNWINMNTEIEKKDNQNHTTCLGFQQLQTKREDNSSQNPSKP